MRLYLNHIHERSLRICLLTYRGNPTSGGQGIYIRLLSKALRDLGHQVDVWSGPPYPELLPGVNLLKVQSLDLWNEAAPFRMPSLNELRDPINRSEWAQTVFGGFPEPLTFSRRVALSFRNGARHSYDIVHDNQCLGPGLLEVQSRVPVVATIHHPVTMDRKIAYRCAKGLRRRYDLWRWYGFVGTQLKVSRRLDMILTVSEASLRDLQREYGLRSEAIRVVGNGIDLEVFRPLPLITRAGNRLIATISSRAPLKGFRYLLGAMQIIKRKRPDVTLTVIGASSKGRARRISELGLDKTIFFTGRVCAEEIARLYARSIIAVVPSLYEGFGFPAGEAMACEVPVVSTWAGALPEVVGTDGEAGLLVQPRSAEALARGIITLLDDPARRAAMGKAGRTRVLARFTWRRTAERTIDAYLEAITKHKTRQYSSPLLIEPPKSGLRPFLELRTEAGSPAKG